MVTGWELYVPLYILHNFAFDKILLIIKPFLNVVWGL